MSFLEDLAFLAMVRRHDDWDPLLETDVLHLEDEAVQFRPDEASIVGELLVVTFVDLALALHLHPFVLLTVRDVEDQPGFQEKMTMFVESPQLAIRALAFVQDDGGQFGLRVMTNLLEDSMSYGEVAWFFIICP